MAAPRPARTLKGPAVSGAARPAMVHAVPVLAAPPALGSTGN